MALTFLSVFLIPYGVLCFFKKSNKLLIKSIIFSIPFSATSLINLSSGVPITIFQFLTIILIFRQFIFTLFKGKFFWPIEERQSINLKLCFIFIFVCILSIVVPIFIDSNYFVHSTNVEAGYPLVELNFSLSNINRLFPLVVGILFIFIIMQNKTNLYDLREYLKVYILSISFITIWGIFQYLLWTFGYDYPEFIFNTLNEDLRVSDSEIISEDGVIRRIYSVTQEPSHFVCFLLSGLPLLYVNHFYGEPLLPRKFGNLLIFLIILTILISFSTTGVGGLLIFAFICYVTLHSKNPITLLIRSLFALIFILITTVVLYQVEFIGNFLNLIFLEKLISGSIIERLFFIEKAWYHFLDYPILGLGMGNVTSSDLLIFLLSNIGIIGTSVFLILVTNLIISLLKNKKEIKVSINSESKYFSLALIDSILITFYVQMFIYLLMGFVWYLPVFYIMVVFMISASSKNLYG